MYLGPQFLLLFISSVTLSFQSARLLLRKWADKWRHFEGNHNDWADWVSDGACLFVFLEVLSSSFQAAFREDNSAGENLPLHISSYFCNTFYFWIGFVASNFLFSSLKFHNLAELGTRCFLFQVLSFHFSSQKIWYSHTSIQFFQQRTHSFLLPNKLNFISIHHPFPILFPHRKCCICWPHPTLNTVGTVHFSVFRLSSITFVSLLNTTPMN